MKIPFKSEPVRFPLTPNRFYTPDFILDKTFEGRRIILEPHGRMSERDAHKYSMFRQFYRNHYFLILLMRNNHSKNCQQRLPTIKLDSTRNVHSSVQKMAMTEPDGSYWTDIPEIGFFHSTRKNHRNISAIHLKMLNENELTLSCVSCTT